MTTNTYQMFIYDDQLKNPIQDESSLEYLMTLCIQQSTQNQIHKQTFQKHNFTKDEDKEILKLVSLYGPNFNKIVKYFPGKTMNMIKNRYYKKLRYLKNELDINNQYQSIHNNSKNKKIH
ncbi:unnamed protein product [Paramecium sonneborni]|uniref:HTH myb-type domain-containing protein n=1 Tax=Paramecium sonneborni TaxID=65129 RepID=A0A8S1RJG1_9CILI|nr:unnamed protein product [Paramecium sonneborni]